MKSKNIYFSILLNALLLASCEKEIEFNGRITEPIIVINSFITPDSIITAHVSESIFFLSSETEFKNIDNAVITLLVNGVLKETLNYSQNGMYRGTYKPAIGDIIKLVVKVPTKNELSCAAKIDAAPEVILPIDTTSILTGTEVVYNYLDYENDSEVDTAAIKISRNIKYTLKFKDNGNVKNFYRLVVLTKDICSPTDLVEEKVTYNYNFSFDDIVSGNNSNSELFDFRETSGWKYNIFSDELFNGKVYSLTFSKDENKYLCMPNYKNSQQYPDKKEVYIFLQSISRDYYLYLKSRETSGEGDKSFSEPVQIHNNVVGGVGILGSYTSNMIKINL